MNWRTNMNIYIVITQEYDAGIIELKRKGVEVFKDAAKAIDYYCSNKPAEILIKELED